jgi:hypothetical protein
MTPGPGNQLDTVVTSPPDRGPNVRRICAPGNARRKNLRIADVVWKGSVLIPGIAGADQTTA